MRICKVTQDNFADWFSLASELWVGVLAEDLTEILNSPRQAGFIARLEDETAIAFMNLSLRYEYVPDATHSPIAFIEGIYVKPEYRDRGIGRDLVQFAERWARDLGCVELAADALLENTVSHTFHTKVGFREVERVVFFIKSIE